jgi:hypothetical protein
MNAKWIVVLCLIVVTAALAQQAPAGRGGAAPGQQAPAGGAGGRGRGGRRRKRRNNGHSGPTGRSAASGNGLVTSKNFYKIRRTGWTSAITGAIRRKCFSEIWNRGRIGTNPPASASWGDCNRDLTRESILSPYPYKTAKEHYGALLAAAKAKGGPTVYTKRRLRRTGTDTISATRRPIMARKWIWESARPPRCFRCSRRSIRSGWSS